MFVEVAAACLRADAPLLPMQPTTMSPFTVRAFSVREASIHPPPDMDSIMIAAPILTPKDHFMIR
jgi:hypothetical protein